MESYADMLGSWSGADRVILTEQAGPDDNLGWGFAVEELPRVIDHPLAKISSSEASSAGRGIGGSSSRAMEVFMKTQSAG
jgi:hypothetical protein